MRPLAGQSLNGRPFSPRPLSGIRQPSSRRRLQRSTNQNSIKIPNIDIQMISLQNSMKQMEDSQISLEKMMVSMNLSLERLTKKKIGKPTVKPQIIRDESEEFLSDIDDLFDEDEKEET